MATLNGLFVLLSITSLAEETPYLPLDMLRVLTLSVSVLQSLRVVQICQDDHKSMITPRSLIVIWSADAQNLTGTS